MIDEALEHLVKGIVDNPAEVVITEKNSHKVKIIRNKNIREGNHLMSTFNNVFQKNR